MTPLSNVLRRGVSVLSSVALALLLAACSGAGGPVSFTPTTSQTPPLAGPRDFLYVANSGSNDIAGFEVHPGGELSLLRQAPFRSAFFPSFISADPQGRFLFVSNTGGRGALDRSPRVNLAVKAIGADGTLTPAGNAALDGVPGESVTDPAGKFLYVGNLTLNGISVFAITSTGGLAEITGSPFTTGIPSPIATPSRLAMDPAGRFLFVAVNFRIVVFAVDVASGALSLVEGSPFSTGTTPAALAVAKGSNYLLVTDLDKASVTALAFDPATGTVSPATASGTVLPGISPVEVTCDSTGNFILVANAGSGSVAVLRFSPSTGTLAHVPGSPFPTGGEGTFAIALDSGGRFVYAANASSNDVSVFALDATTGALELKAPNITSGTTPRAIATVRK
jgi:6-phosphogluconolactonase (cycloisomerase 2 family)